MKILRFKKMLIKAALICFALGLSTKLYPASRLTSNDPFPVYTAGNPLAAFTAWEDCEREQRARFSVSCYRQSANKGRGAKGTTGTCDNACDKDVEIGNIHGRWNMLGLFFPEENANLEVADSLFTALGIEAADLTACFNPAGTNLGDPKNSDLKKEFGFFSVPIEYRKHGVRFEADIATCWDIGLKIQTGVASIKQDAVFNDLTCAAAGSTCTVTTGTCTIPATTVLDCTCKTLVITKTMQKLDTVAKTLELDVKDYCETEMEDITLSAYWSRCFEINGEEKKQADCWSHYTFVPYINGGISAPLSSTRPVARLLALPFANDGHWGFNFDGGFTINFIESVMIGIDAGFTKYSKECYINLPVPTHDLQAGIFPRKANVDIEPGSNWTFGATLGAYHFIDCLSTYIQFKHIEHCKDKITVLSTQPLAGQTAFPISNIKVAKMEDESRWSSSFVNVSLDCDMSSNMALGFFWQAPVRQKVAYRPTTVMGSLIFKF